MKCKDDISKWIVKGYVGCSSRSNDGYCLRIDDPHCTHQFGDNNG